MVIKPLILSKIIWQQKICQTVIVGKVLIFMQPFQKHLKAKKTTLLNDYLNDPKILIIDTNSQIKLEDATFNLHNKC